MHERGPETRGVTVRVADSGGPPGSVTELHSISGRVAGPAGDPLAAAWVTLPGLGRWTSSDEHGRFAITRVPAGTHQAVARARDGGETETTLTVPGAPVELVVEPSPD